MRFIKERQREGILKAKREGVYRGDKRRVDREQVKAMNAAGHGPVAIAKGARVFTDAGLSDPRSEESMVTCYSS